MTGARIDFLSSLPLLLLLLLLLSSPPPPDDGEGPTTPEELGRPVEAVFPGFFVTVGLVVGSGAGAGLGPGSTVGEGRVGAVKVLEGGEMGAALVGAMVCAGEGGKDDILGTVQRRRGRRTQGNAGKRRRTGTGDDLDSNGKREMGAMEGRKEGR